MTVNSEVCSRLRDDIFAGVLSPGEKLTVSTLAKRYGVSPMPVRVALQELQGEGLISGEPNRGARVRVIDAEFVENVFDLRIAVLELLFHKCVRFISNADIERIETIQTQLEEAASSGDLDQVRLINRTFHSAIHAIARNPEAKMVVERNWILVDALRYKLGFREGRVREMNETHRSIIEALKRRDGQRAFALQKQSSELAKTELIDLVLAAKKDV